MFDVSRAGWIGAVSGEPGGVTRIVCRLTYPALALVAAILLAPTAVAASSAAAQRQASLHGILTTYSSAAISTQRITCMMGEEPGRVVKGRQAGKDFIPDAADTCFAVLMRTAQDRGLPDLYRMLLTQVGGDVALADRLPLAIGSAVLSGDGKVALGNGKVIQVPPSLAFDAGFTAAYLKGDSRAGNAEPGPLRLVTQACLEIRKDAGTCFSAGYAQAGRALKSGGGAD